MKQPKVQLNPKTGELELYVTAPDTAKRYNLAADLSFAVPLTVLSAHNLAISIHEAMKTAADWDEKELGEIGM